MKTKSLVLMSLLTAVGAALYLIIPPIAGGMKPDFMLTMMFIGILLFPEVRNVFLLGMTTGITFRNVFITSRKFNSKCH